jgi:hypothetical protein
LSVCFASAWILDAIFTMGIAWVYKLDDPLIKYRNMGPKFKTKTNCFQTRLECILGSDGHFMFEVFIGSESSVAFPQACEYDREKGGSVEG